MSGEPSMPDATTDNQPVAADATRTVVWLDPDQAGTVGEVCGILGLEVVGVGSPHPGRSGELGKTLAPDGSPHPYDDLRAMLAGADADLIWLAADEDDRRDLDPVDAEILLGARQRGTRIVTATPIPTSVMQLASWTSGVRTDQHGGDIARFCPQQRHTPACRELVDVLESFGAVRSVSIQAFGAAGQGSLGSRLFDGADFIVSLLGEPDQVFCAFSADRSGRVLTQVPSDVLGGFHGDLSLVLTYPDGRSASISASDRAAGWSRSARILGSAGTLELHDTSFTWVNADGEIVEEWSGDSTPGYAGIVADQIRRVLDPGAPAPPPVDLRGVLSTAGAALLSARTGEPESPATILRMADAD